MTTHLQLLTFTEIRLKRAEVERQPGDAQYRQHDDERGRHQQDGERFDVFLLFRIHAFKTCLLS